MSAASAPASVIPDLSTGGKTAYLIVCEHLTPAQREGLLAGYRNAVILDTVAAPELTLSTPRRAHQRLLSVGFGLDPNGIIVVATDCGCPNVTQHYTRRRYEPEAGFVETRQRGLLPLALTVSAGVLCKNRPGLGFEAVLLSGTSVTRGRRVPQRRGYPVFRWL